MAVTFGGILAAIRGPASAAAAPSPAIERMATQLVATPDIDGAGEFEDALLVNPANPLRGTLLEFVGPNNAGVHVTHETALMESAVSACIDAIAGSIAASDWNLYGGIRGASNKVALPSDNLQYLLNERPNEEMTAQSFKRAVMTAAVGYGNGYAEIQWDMAGRPVGLWPIAPDRVWPMRNEFGRLVYRVTQDYQGGFVDLDPIDVLHLRGSSLTGIRGDDPIAKAIQTIANSVAINQFNASYFANGTNLGGILVSKSRLDQPAYDRLAAEWNRKHQGAKKSFKTAVLSGDVSYQPIDSNAQKAQLIEAKYQLIEEVARWFRVPPHKIQHLLRATNNNIEHQGLEFTRDTLRPWVREIQQECGFKLISPRGPKKFVELDLDWAEQGDYKSRAEAYATLRNIGVFSANDILGKMGENTIGSAGDIRIVQGAMIPLQRVGESFRTTGTPTEPEDPNDPSIEKTAPGPAAPAPSNAILESWLASTYARIQSRYENGAADMKRKGHDDWKERARAATFDYARGQVAEMAAALGDQLDAAQEWAQHVTLGVDPKVAAASALAKKETE